MALPPHLADLESRLSSRFSEAVAEYRRAVESKLRRDADERLAALAEVPVPTTADWLPEEQLAELDLAPKRTVARDAFDRLAETLRRLDTATNQAEALDALLDGAAHWADRVAIILARDVGLTGWGDRGFEGESLAGRELTWDTTLRERLLASRGCLRLDAGSAAEVLGEFGIEAVGDSVVVPMVLRDRIAALVWADCRDEQPELAPLQILVHAAGQRLELQALSDRAFSPTLWEGATAPGAPLPLWSVLAPAAVEESVAETEEPAIAEAEEALSGPEEEEEVAPLDAPEPETAVAIESEAAVVVEPEAAEPEPVAAEDESEELGAEVWQAEAPAAEPVEPPAEAPFATIEPPEPAELVGEVVAPELAAEPMPEFELESVEPTAEAVEEIDEAERWEPEPESAPAELEAEPVEAAAEAGFEPVEEIPEPEPLVSAEPEAALPTAGTAEEVASADPLGTVRMQLPVLDEPVRPPEETTAPFPVAPPEAASEPAGTQEVEAPPTADEEIDTSEDATVLSVQRPPIPEAPAPPPPPPPAAAEPPTWSAATSPAVAPRADESPMERTGSRFSRSTEVAPPPDVSGPGLAFLAGRANRGVADPVHEEAKRLARLLISEIRLYNEEQVLEGRRHRDLYHRLKEDIDRSRQIYDERVDAAVRGEVDYFQQELVRSLAGGDPRALGI